MGFKIVLNAAHTQLRSGSILSAVFGIKISRSSEGAFSNQIFSSYNFSLTTMPDWF